MDGEAWVSDNLHKVETSLEEYEASDVIKMCINN
jgi:hypothetical protein